MFAVAHQVAPHVLQAIQIQEAHVLIVHLIVILARVQAHAQHVLLVSISTMENVTILAHKRPLSLVSPAWIVQEIVIPVTMRILAQLVPQVTISTNINATILARRKLILLEILAKVLILKIISLKFTRLRL